MWYNVNAKFGCHLAFLNIQNENAAGNVIQVSKNQALIEILMNSPVQLNNNLRSHMTSGCLLFYNLNLEIINV